MPEQLTIDKRLDGRREGAIRTEERVMHQEKNGSWIERIAGTSKDNPEFDEIVRLGQEFRRLVP